MSLGNFSGVRSSAPRTPRDTKVLKDIQCSDVPVSLESSVDQDFGGVDGSEEKF